MPCVECLIVWGRKIKWRDLIFGEAPELRFVEVLEVAGVQFVGVEGVFLDKGGSEGSEGDGPDGS